MRLSGINFSDNDSLYKELNNLVFNNDPIFFFEKGEYSFDLDIYEIEFWLLNKYPNLKQIVFQEIVFEGRVECCSFDKKYDIKTIINFRKSIFKQELNISGCNIHAQSMMFSECRFYEDFRFEENIIEYLYLKGSIFEGRTYFSNSKIHRILFYTKTNENPFVRFYGEVSFYGVDFGNIPFSYLIFDNKVSFVNAKFNHPLYLDNTEFRDEVVFGTYEYLGESYFKGNVYFENAFVHRLLLRDMFFNVSLRLNETVIESIKIDNVYFSSMPLSLTNTQIKNIESEETARILKKEALKSNNDFLAAKFRAQELNWYNKSKKWSYKELKEKIPLLLANYSNSYGTSWWKGVKFTIIVWIIFYTLFVLSRDGWGNTFIWTNEKYLIDAVRFLWVLNGTSELNDSTAWSIIPFLLGKILIGYGIYQTIAAFRKHGQ